MPQYGFQLLIAFHDYLHLGRFTKSSHIYIVCIVSLVVLLFDLRQVSPLCV